MRYLILALLLVTSPAFAWQLTEIKTPEKETVGFILHTESKALVGMQKLPASLRLVCSKNKSTPDIIAIYWTFTEGFNEGAYQVKADVDFQTTPITTWYRVGTLVYTEVSEVKPLTDAMIRGTIASFSWSDKALHHYSTSFDISGFEKEFADFNSACKK